jgi:hypothetical protein
LSSLREFIFDVIDLLDYVSPFASRYLIALEAVSAILTARARPSAHLEKLRCLAMISGDFSVAQTIKLAQFRRRPGQLR